MTKQQLLEKLEKCHKISLEHPFPCNAKTGHEWADAFLLIYINDPEISAAFKHILRWYSE